VPKDLKPSYARGYTRNGGRGSGYIAGEQNRENQGWDPTFGPSANDEIGEDFPLVTSRSRWLVRNNELCGSAADKIVNKVIGAGITTWSNVEDDQGVLNADYNRDVDEIMKRFRDSADYTGRQPLHELTRSNLHQAIETGNGFLVECARVRKDGSLPICFEQFEVEQLDCSKDREPDTNGETGIFQGIEYHAKTGQVVNYHFKDQWDEPDVRSASDVIHLYRATRKQLIGVSWFARIVRRLWSFYRYVDAEVNMAGS